MLSRLLSQLDLPKSAGPGGFPAQFLNRCSETVTILIVILFTRSFGGGYVTKCVEACLHRSSPQKRF